MNNYIYTATFVCKYCGKSYEDVVEVKNALPANWSICNECLNKIDNELRNLRTLETQK